MQIIYDEYNQVTYPCSTCAILEESLDNTCNKEKCIYPKAYRASEEQHQQEGNKMDILTINPCPYLLPCGSCDKRNGELCSQYNGVSIWKLKN